MRRVFVDTETTGLDKNNDQVIEFAAVEVIDRQVGSHLVFRCKPTCRMDPGAQVVHGISLDDLENERPFRSYVQDIIEFMGEPDEVLAHNSDYDVAMLDGEFKRAALDPLFSQRFKIVDTLRMARATVRAKRYGLRPLAQHFGIQCDEEQTHSALYDTMILAQVWLAMTAGQEKIDLQYSQPATFPQIVPQASRVQRIVYLKPEEIEAHKAFCQANKIPCF
jgi:DNA polymerase-3 subunit epsilon